MAFWLFAAQHADHGSQDGVAGAILLVVTAWTLIVWGCFR